MKKYKWLLEIADQKPLLFSVLLLLIGIGALSIVVQNREKRLQEALDQQNLLKNNCDRRLDSVSSYYGRREMQLDSEVKQTLNGVIEDYRSQLDEQKKLNTKIVTTINENKRIIKIKHL